MRCHSCSTFIPLFVDHGREASPLPLMGPGKLRISCESCASPGYYAVEELVCVDGEQKD